ncbi:MAG: PTS sugar transporter subunit IIA [Oenococcus sp.]|uniref:PTS sugar transporter subunit IIA n=1 Tax=Oenococcus TaxID=46254 RepID=UPI0021E717C9|nr:PTS sugar transporter subunit IIA [Oenococcus kitaharae]MCV3295518.1 PTS sugar transporter subunit IIA [Oenococcus kitaharae]
MTVDLVIDKNLLLPRLKFHTQNEALTYLADQLYKQGKVKAEYRAAILKREDEYPTGLPSTKPAVAIPHADYNLVNETSLAVGTLEQPISFHNMEDVKSTLDVEIIIMMAISEPHGQVEMLQRIVSLIQNEELRKKILDATTSDQLQQLITPILLTNELKEN